MSKNLICSKVVAVGSAVSLLLTATFAFAETAGVPVVPAGMGPEAIMEMKKVRENAPMINREVKEATREIRGEVRDVSTMREDAINAAKNQARKAVPSEVKVLREQNRDVRKDVRMETSAEIKVIRQGVTTSVKEARKDAVAEMQANRDEAQKAVMEVRQKAEADIKAIMSDTTKTKEEVKAALEAKREEVQKVLETSREAMKASVTAKREDFEQKLEQARETVKTNIEAKRTELKKKLEVVKSDAKKQAVERVDKEFERINTKQVENFNKVLVRLDEVLKKVVSRTDKAEASGKSVSGVRGTIASAETAIAGAREKVVLQAGKSYTITVTTEGELRIAVEDARQALKGDLVAVQASMKGAQEALKSAVTALSTIPGINTVETASVVPVSTTPVTATQPTN